MSLSFIAALLLALLAAWYLLIPFFTTEESPADSGNRETDLEERARYAEILRGLELDLSTGKISPEQFALAKKELPEIR